MLGYQYSWVCQMNLWEHDFDVIDCNPKLVLNEIKKFANI